jgi:hypothetical protein
MENRSSAHLTLYMQAEDFEGGELCGTMIYIVAIASGSLTAVFGLITSKPKVHGCVCQSPY